MAIRTRNLVIVLFLVAAIVFYLIGNITGLFFLLAAGAVLELLFWAKLLKKRR